jgi:Na+-translocating ferredoxin:NAD+ oxidoreductase subunit B
VVSPTDELDRLLPQTQCRRCGYDGCRPYAEAMAQGEALANRCPPGGPSTLAALTLALGHAPLPLEPSTGSFAPPTVAVIDEALCIGCAKCLPACPVDAIVGARRFMHTVLAAECSGCELCVPACPVDCITLEPSAAEPLSAPEIRDRATLYRARIEARRSREERAREATRAALLAATEVAAAPP